MFKKCLYGVVIIIICIWINFVYLSWHDMLTFKRDPKVLLDQFYRLKASQPATAQHILEILFKQNPNDELILHIFSQWWLDQAEYKQAIEILNKLHAHYPQNNIYTAQLAYAYNATGKWFIAHDIAEQLQHEDVNISFATEINPSNDRIQTVKEKTSSKFVRSLTVAARILPVDDHLNLAYRALRQGRNIEALIHLQQAYKLSHDAKIAMQIAYTYDKLGQQPLAYHYFQLAAHSSNAAIAICANQAMTHLAGTQFKAWPKPYFSEIFFTPFTQTRFGLTVRPLVMRGGIMQENSWQTKEYFVFRRTDDNQSENLGELSQIYEDNVQVIGGGLSLMPVPQWPLTAFVELGGAYNLLPHIQPRWKIDLRGGLMYYQVFGMQSDYVDKLLVYPQYYADAYADAVYFSRYNNNVIAGLQTHQGLRVARYKSSEINLYVIGRVLADTQRQFYNNFAEAGPGVAWVPSNRFNVELRWEHRFGVYLPAGSTPNPYGRYYVNNILQFFFYVKM